MNERSIGAVVTIDAIYRELLSLKDAVLTMNVHVTELRRDVPALHRRVRGIDRRIMFLMIATSAVSAGLSQIVSVAMA